MSEPTNKAIAANRILRMLGYSPEHSWGVVRKYVTQNHVEIDGIRIDTTNLGTMVNMKSAIVVNGGGGRP